MRLNSHWEDKLINCNSSVRFMISVHCMAELLSEIDSQWGPVLLLDRTLFCVQAVSEVREDHPAVKKII